MTSRFLTVNLTLKSQKNAHLYRSRTGSRIKGGVCMYPDLAGEDRQTAPSFEEAELPDRWPVGGVGHVETKPLCRHRLELSGPGLADRGAGQERFPGGAIKLLELESLHPVREGF